MKLSLSTLFIPQEKNNFRAGILKNGFLFMLISFYLLNHSFIKSFTLVKPGVLGYSSEITAQKVFDQTNQERNKLNLVSLKYNSLLSQSATQKAQDMFANNYWAHTSSSGTTPWDFFKSVGYQYFVAGENLARDFYDTESLIKAWMNSPTHKENIINSKYQEIGIGVVNGTLNGLKTTLVVQHFGTPINAVVDNQNNTQNQNETILSEPVVGLDKNILSETQNQPINPLTLTKIFSFVIFGLIISVLFVDGYLTLKKGVHRMTGSTVSHIGFLVVILLFIIYQQQGVIF
jgi:uncharacterized protein YkwD